MNYSILIGVIIFAMGCNPEKKIQEIKSIDGVKIEWLKNIKNTIRISSNHYSDFVVDEEGSAYIACFATDENMKDRIYIVKIDKNGNMLWEVGESNLGRATAIGIDGFGSIWVTGIFEGVLSFDNAKGGMEQAMKFDGVGAFLACFDTNGKCSKLTISEGEAYPVNCEVNKNGVVVISGNAGQNLKFGHEKLQRRENMEEFVAGFDLSGKCLWIKNTNINSGELLSGNDGYFYSVGALSKELLFENSTLKTDSFGAYLLKINEKGQVIFLKELKNENSQFSSILSIGSFCFSNNETLIITANTISNSNLFLSSQAIEIEGLKILEIDKKGVVLSEKSLIENIPNRSVSTITQLKNGDCFVTCGSMKHSKIQGKDYYFDYENLDLILKLDSKQNVTEVLLPNKGFDGGYRVGKIKDESVFYTGHFRGEYSIKEKTLIGETGHSLFLMKLSNEN